MILENNAPSYALLFLEDMSLRNKYKKVITIGDLANKLETLSIIDDICVRRTYVDANSLRESCSEEGHLSP